MWSRLLTLVIACVLLLLPAHALAGTKEKVVALAPSGLVLVMDAKGNELVAQNADNPAREGDRPAFTACATASMSVDSG